MADKVVETIVEALKVAMAQPGEQRLFRAGRLPGLFSSRAGLPGAAATQALKDGLLEITRTETKAKTATVYRPDGSARLLRESRGDSRGASVARIHLGWAFPMKARRAGG